MFRPLLVLLLFFASTLIAKEQTICLNMIVKNESKAIERCLASVKDIIDCWVIVDTGSTDGTQEIIEKYLEDKPGSLYERPWVNFEHNRNEALTLARGRADYILFIDADEQLQFSSKFDKNSLSKDLYLCVVKEPNTYYHRSLFIKDSIPWKWEGILHETIVGPSTGYSEEILTQIINISNTADGCRSQDIDKYKRDVEVLENALEKDPTNLRHLFYLGQSHILSKNYPEALKVYERCVVAFESGSESSWYAKFMLSRLHEVLKTHTDCIVEEYCRVYQERPSRAEPLFYLSRYALSRNNPLMGYVLMPVMLALALPEQDCVHVEHWIYNYGLLLLYADCSGSLGRFKEARTLYEEILKKENVPDGIRNAVLQKLTSVAYK